MNEDTTKQLQVAEEQLKICKEVLEKATRIFEDWKDRSLRREDGSTRQDNLNDEIGESYADDVWKARCALDKQQALVDKLKEQLRQGAL